MFRKKVFGLVILLVVILVIIRLFLLNYFIQQALIYGGERAFGAKVEIGSVDFSFLKGTLTIKNVAVGDKNNPYRNLFTFEKTNFALDTRLLLKKFYHINNISIEGLQVFTARKTSAALPKRKQATVKKQENQAFANLKKGFSLDSIQSRLGINELLDFSSITTPQKVDISINAIKNLPDNIEQHYKNADIEGKLKQADLEIENLKKTKFDLAKIDQYPTYLNTLNKAKEKVELIPKTTDVMLKNFNQEFNYVNKTIKEIEIQAKKDIETIKQKSANLKSTKSNLTNILIGPYVYEFMAIIKDYAEKLKALKQDNQKIEKPKFIERFNFKGQDIAFPILENHPKWLIKNVLLSGSHKAHAKAGMLTVKGQIKEIVSNQNFRNIPTSFVLEVKDIDINRHIFINGFYDQRGRANIVSVDFGDHNGLIQESFWDYKLIPFKINQGIYDFDGNLLLDDGVFSTKLLFKTKDTVIIPFGEAYNKESLLNIILEKIFTKNRSYQILAQFKNNQFLLDSNLDELAAQAIDEYIKENIEKIRQELQKFWDEKVQPEIDKVNQEFESKKKELEAEYNKQIKEWQDQVEKYQQEIARVESEIKNKQKELEASLKAEADKLKQQVDAEIEKKQKELEAQKEAIEAEKKRLEAEAQAEADRLKKEAEKKLEAEKKKAIDNLFNKVTEKKDSQKTQETVTTNADQNITENQEVQNEN